MNYRTVFALFAVMVVPAACLAAPGDVVRDSGIRGGVVVHLGCGDGTQTAEMLVGPSYLVHGLDASAANVAKAREYLRGKGLYGRVSVARFDGKALPYADNTVNLIVADSLGDVPQAEAMRVLTPLGAMVVGGRKTVKPWPETIDDWPQYLNKADNNAVAMDSVAGPPRWTQWTDGPRWSRSHMAIPTIASLVTSRGRLFTIEDAAPPDNPFLPAAFQIVARDAFNGTHLWSRKITRWEAVTMYIKCEPLQQQRRMAVQGDTLYCTFELEGPVSAVDAATGEVKKVYKNTSPTQEVAYADGILYLNVGDRFPSAAYNIVKTKGKPYVQGVDPKEPFYGGGFRKGYAPQIKDKAHPVSAIVAIDPKTGNELWAVRGINTYTAGSLAIQGSRAVYQAADGLFCVDAKTGKRLWARKKEIGNARGHDSKTPGTLPNTVVIAGGKVFAVETSRSGRISPYAKSTLFAYSLEDGKELWSAPITGNYESSCDVCFVDGTLWIGGLHPTQLNVETGAVMKRIVQKMTGPMSHDRCYRNYITEKYFINTKTGGADFLELATGKEFPNHWTRGCCGLGVIPANGLVYSTPYSCQCSMGSMLPGMRAYASLKPNIRKPDQPVQVKRAARLEKGPAYGQTGQAAAAGDADWPAYRHDGFRSGITKAAAPTKLNLRWKAKLPGKPSAVTIAAGKVYVCEVDAHTLHALDASTGKPAWTFTAAGRLDSPPTYYKGLLLLGSRDGWVYCLRAADGALAWRFKDLPDALVGAHSQLESRWPVFGSVLVVKHAAYFAAGRSSFLDGGIFLYALDPVTGELKKSRAVYGPFSPGSGFPVGGHAGFRNDVMVSDGEKIYLRQKAFGLDLADATPGRHILPTSGFLDGQPQHRTCWTLAPSISTAIWGDIMVSNGRDYCEVRGFPIYANHSYFDPRRNGYTLFAGILDAPGAAGGKATPGKAVPGRRGGKKAKRPGLGRGRNRGRAGRERWSVPLPITGKAIALGGGIVYVAGEPMTFDHPSYKNYVAAYTGKLGGRLLAVSAKDGKKLSEIKLPSPCAWDSLAVANGTVFLTLADGTIQCLGE